MMEKKEVKVDKSTERFVFINGKCLMNSVSKSPISFVKYKGKKLKKKVQCENNRESTKVVRKKIS